MPNNRIMTLSVARRYQQALEGALFLFADRDGQNNASAIARHLLSQADRQLRCITPLRDDDIKAVAAACVTSSPRRVIAISRVACSSLDEFVERLLSRSPHIRSASELLCTLLISEAMRRYIQPSTAPILPRDFPGTMQSERLTALSERLTSQYQEITAIIAELSMIADELQQLRRTGCSVDEIS